MEYIYRKENNDFKKRIRKHIPMIFIFSFLFIAVYLSILRENFGLYDFGIIPDSAFYDKKQIKNKKISQQIYMCLYMEFVC